MGNKKLLTELIYQPELLDAQLQTALPALPKLANPKLLIEDTQSPNSLKNEATDRSCNLNLQAQKIYFSHHWKILLDYQVPEIIDSPSEWLQRLHPDEVKIAEALPIPVFITTAPKGIILYVNQSYTKSPSNSFLGVSADELIGRNAINFLYNSADKKLLQNILLKESCIRHYELQIKRVNDGRPIWIDLSLQRISGKNQNLFVACCFDITKRKELTQVQDNFKTAQTTIAEDKKYEEFPHLSQSYLSNVFLFIKENYRHQISLREVAQAVGYSCAYLTNLVQQETGKSVNQWIKEYRMKEARLLLIETNQLVKEVAIAVGYQGTEHFIRQFRQLHGLTPQDWRNQHRN